MTNCKLKNNRLNINKIFYILENNNKTVHPIANTFFLSFYLISALVCCTLLIYSYNRKEGNRESSIKKVLILYFGIIIIFGLFTGLRETKVIQPMGRAYPFIALYSAAISVLFFHFIFLLTNKKQKNAIPTFNYTLPGVIFIVTAFFFYLLYPRIGSQKELNQYMLPYFSLYTLLYQMYYGILSLKYILSYKKEIERRNIEIDKNINWLYSLIVIKACFILLIIFQIILGYSFVMLSASYILSSFLFIIVLFNVLEKNYYFLPHLKNNTVLAPTGHIFHESYLNEDVPQSDQKNVIFSQKDFENYFHEQKPYLNPTFKIDDLSLIFNTNRTYMSKFINGTYDMNFNQFVNSWRLNEVKELKLLTLHKNKSIEELARLAGFGSLRSYLRAVRAASEKQTTDFNG